MTEYVKLENSFDVIDSTAPVGPDSIINYNSSGYNICFQLSVISDQSQIKSDYSTLGYTFGTFGFNAINSQIGPDVNVVPTNTTDNTDLGSNLLVYAFGSGMNKAVYYSANVVDVQNVETGQNTSSDVSNNNTPLINYSFSDPAGNFYKITFPEYEWIKIPELFSEKAEVVDFNSLTTSQQQAIASGSQPPYNGQGGSDTVTLPDANHFNESVGNGQILNWRNDTVFTTGSGSSDTTTVNIPVGQPTSVAYNVVLGAGTDTVNMAGNGNLTVTGGLGKGIINANGTGSITINDAGGPETINLSGKGDVTLNVGATTSFAPDIISFANVPSVQSTAGVCKINFTGPNETVIVSGGNTAAQNLFVYGFQKGDQLVFQGQTALTSCAQFYPNLDPDHPSILSGEVDVYSSTQHYATVIFDSKTTAQNVLPINYQGSVTGTGLTLDTGSAPVGDPSTPAGVNINWTFVHAREGNSHLEAYVPETGISGVTIATGVDLGQGLIGAADLQGINTQNDNNLTALYSAAQKGVTWKSGALGYLENYYEWGHNVIEATSRSVSITPEQAQTLTYNAETKTLTALNTFLSGQGLMLSALPVPAQTVIFDIAYRLNISAIPNNSSTKQFWSDFQIAAESKSSDSVYASNWSAVYNDLIHHFNQIDPNRNALEAKLLLQIPGVSDVVAQQASNGGSAAQNPVAVASAGLDISGQFQEGSSLSGSGTITSATDAGALSLTLASTSSTFAGSINETTGNPITLLVQGTGSQALAGASTYSGGTYLDGGAVVALNTAALGVGAVHMVDPTLQLGASGTYSNEITLDVASAASGAAHTTSNDPATLVVAAGVTAILAGTIDTGSGTNALGYAIDPNQPLVVSGAGAGATLVLTGENTYTGGTTLQGTITLDLAAQGIAGADPAGPVGTGTITFTGPNQVLKVETVALGSDSGHTLANHITGFGSGDTIDLAGIGTATSLSYNATAHTLTVSGGSQMETLSIDAAPTGSLFSLSPDGTGGTKVGLLAANAAFTFKLTDAHFSFSNGHDVMTEPNGSIVDVTGVHTLTFADGTVTEHAGSALVDDLYYDVTNPDVWAAHVDPTTHYNQNGWHEGRNPNADFSTVGYLAANQDVAKAGINPLAHYDQYGWKEGRDPSANFDNELYLKNNPDVAAAGLDPLAHYLQYGQAEGRQAYAAIGNAASFTHGSFDAEYYLLSNPDVAKAALAAGGDTFAFAYQHYDTYGWKEGRNPDAEFNTSYYLAHNQDVAAAGIDPLTHYDQYGWKEGRDPSAAFHTNAYLAANPDVAAAHIDPLLHYLQNGANEGRHLV